MEESAVVFYFFSVSVFLTLLFSIVLNFIFISVAYSLDEKVHLLCDFLGNGRNARRSAIDFNLLFNKNVRHKYVLDLFKKFRGTGSVGRKSGSGRPGLDEVLETGILGEIAVNPKRSLRKVREDAAESVCHSTIRKI